MLRPLLGPEIVEVADMIGCIAGAALFALAALLLHARFAKGAAVAEGKNE